MSFNRLLHKFLLASLIGLLLANFAGAQNAQSAQDTSPASKAPKAQNTESPAQGYTDAEHEGAEEFNLWGGYSPDSPERIGVTQDRQLLMAGFGYTRVLLAWDRIAWKYTAETAPLFRVSQPTFNGFEISRPSRVPANMRGYLGRRTTYGAGLAPIGFRLNFRRRQRIQPILDINGGVVYFTRQVPVAGSSRFNFTFSTGTGVQIFTGESKALTLGYKFHHISNANTGNPYNPGIDSSFFYAAFSFFR